MAATWTPKSNCPTTVDQLRKTLADLARKKTGKALIDPKFTTDHLFAGHVGSVLDLAKMLAKLRDLPHSTLMITSMEASAQKEVLNWIQNVPAARLTYGNGTWTIDRFGSAVVAVGSYKFATVDLQAL